MISKDLTNMKRSPNKEKPLLKDYELGNRRRVIVVGLDGVSWELLDELMRRNLMPNLEYLAKNGTFGGLKSTIPPITGPAWVSFVTGKNPGKHGCYDFLLPDGSLNNLRPISSIKIESKTFYEYLESLGNNVILVNLPNSTPPRVRRGIVVADFLSSSDQLIYPKELSTEIPEIRNYRLSPKGDLLNDVKVEELVDDVVEIENTRFEITKRLFEKPWDFFFVLFSGTDWIQHNTYDKLITGKLEYPLLLYKKIDEYIGWLVRNIPKNTILFIISDHGFRVFNGTFHINDWLEKEGFLSMKETSSRIYSHQLEKGMLEERNKRKKVKVSTFFLKLVDKFPVLFTCYVMLKKITRFQIQTPTLIPETDKTYAYSTTTGSSNFSGIYINSYPRFNDGIIKTKEEYEKIRDEISEKLALLKETENMLNVWKKDEIYSGDHLDSMPDIIVESSSFVIDKSFNFPKNIKRNEHHIDGIFIAFGKEIRPEGCIKARIMDIAPTILHIFGVPIPRDMDGRVLKEIFDEGSELGERPVAYQSDERERIQRIFKRVRQRTRKKETKFAGARR